MRRCNGAWISILADACNVSVTGLSRLARNGLVELPVEGNPFAGAASHSPNWGVNRTRKPPRKERACIQVRVFGAET